MATKPLYGKYMTSSEFRNREDAEKFAKDQKKMYKEAGISVKHDINRTTNSYWKATLYAKV